METGRLGDLKIRSSGHPNISPDARSSSEKKRVPDFQVFDFICVNQSNQSISG